MNDGTFPGGQPYTPPRERRMINKILTALAVCLSDQYGETVTAEAVEEEKTA